MRKLFDFVGVFGAMLFCFCLLVWFRFGFWWGTFAGCVIGAVAFGAYAVSDYLEY